MNSDTLSIIHSVAAIHGIDPDLLAALVMEESRGDQWDVRYEPRWKHFVTPEVFAKRLGISVETEKRLQAMSWGPAQVMGAVARQHGFTLELTRLSADPALALKYSCMHLAWLNQRCLSEADLIASYNGGWGALKKAGDRYSNQKYVDAVSARAAGLRRLN